MTTSFVGSTGASMAGRCAEKAETVRTRSAAATAWAAARAKYTVLRYDRRTRLSFPSVADRDVVVDRGNGGQSAGDPDGKMPFRKVQHIEPPPASPAIERTWSEPNDRPMLLRSARDVDDRASFGGFREWISAHTSGLARRYNSSDGPRSGGSADARPTA